MQQPYYKVQENILSRLKNAFLIQKEPLLQRHNQNVCSLELIRL
uniref:Uncharacterized protein n=1 Tax=Rhizophora mucronata TaxID=61149 RepID=A0A2P2P096_RHIMU